jgi:predicted ArsR family transcriptional regulator
MAKGDYSIRYNPDKLREMIAKGMTAKEITKEFKISPYTLREHLVMLQNLDKKIYVIKGLFNYSQVEESNVKKEGIVFTKEMLEKTGFTPGDCFEMNVEEDRIILKKVECKYQVDD